MIWPKPPRFDNAALKNKTGFQGRKIWDIIYKLKKQGKIKSERKGTYVKAWFLSKAPIDNDGSEASWTFSRSFDPISQICYGYD